MIKFIEKHMINPLTGKISYSSIRELHRIIHIKNNRIRKQFNSLRKEYYKNFWLKISKSIDAEIIFSNNDELHQIIKNNKSTFVQETRVRLNDCLIESLFLDKERTQSLLKAEGFRVPKFVELSKGELPLALRFQEVLGKPVVVKPAQGTAGGRGVTPDINDLHTLRTAFTKASRMWPRVIVEEHVSGKNFRLVYLNGKLIDAIERNHPTIIGDGIHNVSQLINYENLKRLSNKPVTSLLPITMDEDLDNSLRKRNFNRLSVIKKEEIFMIKNAINENASRDNKSVFKIVSDDIKNIGSEIVSFFNVELAGIDLICDDITLGIENNNFYIIEVNIPPGLHYHYMINDYQEINNIGKTIMDYIFDK